MVRSDLLSNILPRGESGEINKTLIIWNTNNNNYYTTEGVTYNPKNPNDTTYILDDGREIDGNTHRYITFEELKFQKGGKCKTSKRKTKTSKRKTKTYVRKPKMSRRRTRIKNLSKTQANKSRKYNKV